MNEIIAYHGSYEHFLKFSENKIKANKELHLGWGFYFVDNPQTALKYGNYIYKVKLFNNKNHYHLIDFNKPIEPNILYNILTSLYYKINRKKINYDNFKLLYNIEKEIENFKNMIELNKIYNEDCLEGMKRIPDKSVDMILCDLPYGITQNKWDSVIPLDSLWKEYNRIIKDNGAIVLTASTPFDKVLGVSNIKNLRYEWIWKKNNVTGHLNAHRMPMKEHENILVFYNKQPTYNPQGLVQFNKTTRRGSNGSNYGKSNTENFQEFTNYPRSILEFSYDKNKLHPTQKPIALFEYLIRTYTNEGEIVLDNCIGSGTTAVACINTNRNYIGFELDKHYCDIANERIRKALAGKEVGE